MSEIKDGGPAFPTVQSVDEYSDRVQGYVRKEIAVGGMTLRDYFAAKALQAEIITTCSDATPEAAENAIRAAREKGRTITDHIAANAYGWADAMLRAREQK